MVWFKVLCKILGPILSIIKDSEKIIQDNFFQKFVLLRAIMNLIFYQEFLNKMIEKLKVQKNKLLKAKETINLRRKFTEKNY